MDQNAEVLPGTLEMMILAVIRDDARHGFGIARMIEQRSSGRLTIEEGSLYPALRRLERQQFVTSEWRRSDTGRRARFYQITPDGLRRLERASKQWQIDAAAVTAVLGKMGLAT